MQMVHSLMSARWVEQFVEQNHPVGPMGTCRLHMSGVNDVYQLTTDRGDFFFKVYRLEWRSVRDVCYEADLIGHLSRAGVSISLPAANRSGESVVTVDAPEGNRAAVLYDAAPGHQPTWPFYRDAGEAHLLGATLARIHAAARDFSSRHPRDPIDAYALLDAPLATLTSFADLLPNGVAPAADAMAKLRGELDAFVAQGLTETVCHGDFHCGNVFLTDDSKATIFDFDACGPGWAAFDLARWASLVSGAEGAASWNAFLGGYEQVAPLTEGDKAAVPLFVKLRPVQKAQIKLSLVQRGQGEWWDVGFFLADLLNQIEA